MSDPLSLVNDLFGELFSPQTRGGSNLEGVEHLQTRLNVVEKNDRYEATFELPGVNKEDIEINIDGSYVSVQAHAKSEDLVKDGERILCREISSTSWGRRFQLPTEVDENAADASYVDGLLKLVLPKKSVAAAKRLTVR